MRRPVKEPGPQPNAMPSRSRRARPASDSNASTIGNSSCACSRCVATARSSNCPPTSSAAEHCALAVSMASSFMRAAARRHHDCARASRALPPGHACASAVAGWPAASCRSPCQSAVDRGWPPLRCRPRCGSGVPRPASAISRLPATGNRLKGLPPCSRARARRARVTGSSGDANGRRSITTEPQRTARHVHALPETGSAQQHRIAMLAELAQQLLARGFTLHQQAMRGALRGAQRSRSARALCSSARWLVNSRKAPPPRELHQLRGGVHHAHRHSAARSAQAVPAAHTAAPAAHSRRDCRWPACRSDPPARAAR